MLRPLNIFEVAAVFFILALLWEFFLKDKVSWLWWRFTIWQASGDVSVAYAGLFLGAVVFALAITCFVSAIHYGYTGRWF